ncbi:MAG: hypothetical protein QOF28_1981, partial [Actinomycetota bacterium]|nr:hypothetical protein [Actinomycetota bacterium]
MSLPPDDGGAGDDDPGPSGGPPHPMDRVWRHPSELPSIGESGAAGGPSPKARNPGPARVRSLLVPLGAGAVGALLTVGVLAAAGVLDQGGTPTAASRTTSAGPATNEIADIAREVAPAIVAVRVVGKSGVARTGSGVCIRHAGQVLTSDRLVAGARHVEIVTSDGKVQTAGVIGRDPVSDLALLSIDGALEAADLATTQSLHVGEPVYAVGADTLGTPWVSVGIVSSLAGRVATSSTTMCGLIESNALTEPAVAGGALLDADGRVAGILMTPVDGNPATVAVPIRFAGRVADALRADGHVDHGWLGLAGKVKAGNRLVITALAVGGPSQNAGMRVGDVVVSADAQPIATINDLMATARRYWPGDHIQLDVTRGRD